MKKKQFKIHSIRRFFAIESPNGMALTQICWTAVFVLVFVCPVLPQRVAVISPNPNVQSTEIAEQLSLLLSERLNLVDASLAKMLFDAEKFERPYNLSRTQSKEFGARAGCNFFLLISSDTLRRTSFERDKYFESYATFFLVSAKTGKLIFWRLSKFEEQSAKLARDKLIRSLKTSANKMLEKIDSSIETEISKDSIVDSSKMDTSESVRPPMPYRRLKPKYTNAAALYDVLATVDIEVSVDEKGRITSTEIFRWAGFGLDESVAETVKKMNWRPADRNGKTLPMRVLLRYNFKNIVTEN